MPSTQSTQDKHERLSEALPVTDVCLSREGERVCNLICNFFTRWEDLKNFCACSCFRLFIQTTAGMYQLEKTPPLRTSHTNHEQR